MRTIIIFSALLIFSISTEAQFHLMNSTTNKTLEDVFFIDEFTGVAVGDSGIIVRTTDGGLNWITVFSNDSLHFTKVAFFDAQNGIAAGNQIFTTDNAGQTWTFRRKGLGNFSPIHDMQVVNDSTCILSSIEVSLMRSSNKGITWDTLVAASSGLEFLAFSFLNDTIGFVHDNANTSNQNMLKTWNGGMTWNPIQSNTPNNHTVMESIKFIDENIGFQGGWYNPHFIKTTDGGLSWSPMTGDTTCSFAIRDFDIRASRPNSYYACGFYGEILKSNDGGNNWLRIDSGVVPNNQTLNSIFFLNDTLGWVVGSNGIILRTNNGSGVLSTKNISNQIDFTIYPNPTADKLFIEVANLNNFKGVIEILNIEGQLLWQQGADNLNNGIDIAALSKGNYFIRLTMGNQHGIKQFTKSE